MAVRVRQSDMVRRRIERFFLIVAIFYLILVARLIWLQAVNGGYFRHRASEMRTQHIILHADRGAIFDRDGKALAITTHSGMLVCDPTQVPNVGRAAEAVARILGTTPGAVLPSLTPRKLPNKEDDHYVVVRGGLGPEAVEAFRQMRGTKQGAKDLQGLSLQDQPERVYPAGRDAVHVVGFLIPDANGRPTGVMGLEQSLDSLLRGRDGYVEAEVDARRRIIPDTQVDRREAQDGPDVKLTLDSSIQHIVESELAACYEKNRPVGATAIVMDPKTGDILAMVSYPNFDPATRKELRKNAEAIRDRALGLYEPGSTMKPISGAAALDAKVISPATTFYCSGHLPIGNRTINCVLHGASERNGHGAETIREIIEHSCNVGAAQIGVVLGMDSLSRYLTAFGLMAKSGIGLPTDTRGRLGFGSQPQRGKGKAARVAFGQSVSVTPLGMTVAYAAIANNGMLMRPRLVQCYQDATGKVVKSCPPQKGGQVISPQTAAEIRACLEAVVTSGTGKGKAEVPGYTVAGKTGTAQKVVPGQRGYSRSKYIASFIGYLPARNPRAVICVVVDEPQASIYGAQVAAPVFQAIGRQLMWYWKVPPDNPGSLLKGRVVRN